MAAEGMFTTLPPAQQDPLMQALEAVQADLSPDRVDLGVGVYMDERGRSAVLPSVKTAEQWLLATQDSKGYLSSAGSPAFTAQAEALLLGSAAADAARATIQTVGGSGALRVGAQLIAMAHPDAVVWIPDPSWANHHPLIRAAGVQTAPYPYYDRTRHTVAFEQMLAAIAQAKPGDAVILHGCCHNPSGADLSLGQWQAVADRLRRLQVMPFVDIAYQGFAASVDEDAGGLRLLAEQLPEVLIATSFSKNFGLYRDRVGALALVTRGGHAETAWRHMLQIVRTSYSMPPDHGAAIVAHVLQNPELRRQWLRELAEMRERIKAMRQNLADLLADARYRYLARQNGMFSFLDLTPEQVVRLREEYHIHAVSTGRINLAGLTTANVERVAAAVRDVTGSA